MYYCLLLPRQDGMAYYAISEKGYDTNWRLIDIAQDICDGCVWRLGELESLIYDPLVEYPKYDTDQAIFLAKQYAGWYDGEDIIHSVELARIPITELRLGYLWSIGECYEYSI